MRLNNTSILPWSLLFLLLITIISTTAQQTIQTTVVVTITPTHTAPRPASYTCPDAFKNAVLSASNAYRKEHNATRLEWNETLTEYAAKWAEGCEWKHSHGPYGENLAFGYPNATAAIAAWGDEREKYDFRKPTGFTEETGHFTQLVWRATSDVGCAAVNCGYSKDGEGKDRNGKFRMAQGWYVVCEYWPAGNVMRVSSAPGGVNGLFKVNVQENRTYSGPEDEAETSPSRTAAGGEPTGTETETGSPTETESNVSAARRLDYAWGGYFVLLVMALVCYI